jgi:hypothetical protein
MDAPGRIEELERQLKLAHERQKKRSDRSKKSDNAPRKSDNGRW